MKIKKSAIAWIKTGKSLVIQYQGQSIRLREGSTKHTDVLKIINQKKSRLVTNNRIISYLFGKEAVKTVRVKAQKKVVKKKTATGDRKERNAAVVKKLGNKEIVMKADVAWLDSGKSLIIHLKDRRPVVLKKGRKRCDQERV